jgi:hypothetical protein
VVHCEDRDGEMDWRWSELDWGCLLSGLAMLQAVSKEMSEGNYLLTLQNALT